MVKYRFKRIETVEDLLKAIGRMDIPSTKVTIRQPVIDEETGEFIADIEIEFSDELTATDEEKLKEIMAGMGLILKEIKK